MSDEDEDEDGDNLPYLLDKIPEIELQKAVERRTGIKIVARTQESHFSGPLPPPEVLQHYETIVTGFAKRIVTMAEKEQNHRHEIEQTAVHGSVSAEKRGQTFAFLLCGSVILGSIGLIAVGHPVSGTLLAGSTLVGLAYIFITGRRQEESEGEDDT